MVKVGIDMINLRRYIQADCEIITAIFYETIHNINIRDYSKEKLNA